MGSQCVEEVRSCTVSAASGISIVSDQLLIKGYTYSDELTRYLTCTTFNTTKTPDDHELVQWYWKLAPLLVCNVGRMLGPVLMYEFAITQSPEKMEGLVTETTVA